MISVLAPPSRAIGVPHERLDGKEKVSGRACYAADTPAERLAYGVFALANIPRGRIAQLDVGRAEHAAGVLRIFTHENMPRLNPVSSPPAGQSLLPLQSDRIAYEGQPIALAVAATLEQAAHAASLVRAEYEREPFNVDFRTQLERAVEGQSFFESDTRVGDVERELAQAPIRIAQRYRTADRHHCAMEPSATVARWENGSLTLDDATQYVWGVRMAVAQALDIAPERVRVRSSYAGGGFGSKGYVWPHQVLTAAAARELERPLKVVLTRAQAFTAHGYQTASEQALDIGAERDGTLRAVRATSINPTSRFDDYVEYCALSARSLYAAPAIETRHRVVHVDRSTPTPMRAPHDGVAMVGLEIAMDELAYEAGIDSLELRLRNYAQRDPTTGKPFSSKELRACYRLAAERFGWSGRNPRPGAMREGRVRIGWGMATALMGTFRMPASARVTVESDGRVLIEAGTQEIGTGVRTIMPQIAADVLGVPIEQVRIALGDTTLPETGGTFGSSTTMSVGSAVLDAATRLRDELRELGAHEDEDLGAVLSRSGRTSLSADGAWSPGEEGDFSMHTFGAVFAEVRVDEDLPIPRVSRVVGAYSAGRIINPTTARSQIQGGMVWGIGQALLEESSMDPTLGRYLSKNLAGYLVPANADVPELEVIFAEEVDAHASPLGAKGIGELGAVGVAPAIANAVFHATGVRVRELPIRLEMLLA
ncbi:xanthine dehydrogenase family protein molybdopterin-binding subunit [bacterium]|nr:MAG: xanthine dehydrogenase family protein molybdopterin-binding subunit [bacterium]